MSSVFGNLYISDDPDYKVLASAVTAGASSRPRLRIHTRWLLRASLTLPAAPPHPPPRPPTGPPAGNLELRVQLARCAFERRPPTLPAVLASHVDFKAVLLGAQLRLHLADSLGRLASTPLEERRCAFEEALPWQ